MRGLNLQNFGWMTIQYIETLVNNRMFVVQVGPSVGLSCSERMNARVSDREARIESRRSIHWTRCVDRMHIVKIYEGL